MERGRERGAGQNKGKESKRKIVTGGKKRGRGGTDVEYSVSAVKRENSSQWWRRKNEE